MCFRVIVRRRRAASSCRPSPFVFLGGQSEELDLTKAQWRLPLIVGHRGWLALVVGHRGRLPLVVGHRARLALVVGHRGRTLGEGIELINATIKY